MPAFQTYVKIAEQTLTANAASFLFNNLPQNYDALAIYASCRGVSAGGGGETLYLRLNEDLTGKYESRYVYTATVAGPYTAKDANNSNIVTILGIPGSAHTANSFGSTVIFFPGYSNNTFYKHGLTMSAVNNNTATNDYSRSMFGGFTYESTSPITSITLGGYANNIATGSKIVIYGIRNNTNLALKATGGTVYQDNTYVYHAFRASGTFKPNQNLTADVLIIAGGGGSGNAQGGGGAGGLTYLTNQSLTSGTSYSVAVGAGGGTTSNGGNSVWNGVNSATGGGGSANFGNGGTFTNGSSGGSGGGGVSRDTSSTATGGSGTAGQGNSGGSSTGTRAISGGGGGGAGSAGGNSVDYYQAGKGGDGVSTYSSWGLATNTGVLSNGLYYYCAGGTGGANFQGAFNHGLGADPTTGTGPRNSGNGGWGNAAGGSGVIIVRYVK